MVDWVYRIRSDTFAWSEITEEPMQDSVQEQGAQLLAADNHVHSGPVEIDEFTREYTLSFSSEENWNEFCAFLRNNSYPVKPGFTTWAVTDSDSFPWADRPYFSGD